MSKRPKEHWCWRKYPDDAAQRLLYAYKDFCAEHEQELTCDQWSLLEQRVEASFEKEAKRAAVDSLQGERDG